MVTTNSAAGPPRIDNYEVFGRLAEGHDTVVWAANARRTVGFVRPFAIKCLKLAAAKVDGKRKSLIREAAIGAALDHPALGQVIDVGVWDGRAYMVCELIRGWNLRSVLATAALTRTPVPLAAALSLIHTAAEGAHYLHELRGRDGRSLGLVHRAIDDGNLLVARAGYAKLIDFGLTTPTAFETAEPLRGRECTKFSAPELSSHATCDRRADVYGLGVALAAIARRMDDDCPKDLRAVISRAVSEHPRNRFGSARDLQRSLEAVAMARDIPLSTAATARFLEGLYSPSEQPAPRAPLRSVEAPQARAMPGLDDARRGKPAVPPTLGRTRVRVTRGGRSPVQSLGFNGTFTRRHSTGC